MQLKGDWQSSAREGRAASVGHAVQALSSEALDRRAEINRAARTGRAFHQSGQV